MGGDRQLERARKKLEQFLKSSVHYRASSLLSKIQNTDMYSEMAILFGRVSISSQPYCVYGWCSSDIKK